MILEINVLLILVQPIANLFSYKLRGHFNEYGYFKVSDIIFKEIYND